jgi:hypothetical protein
VPSFENESDNFILVVLESRNDYVAAIVDKLVESRTAEVRGQLAEEAGTALRRLCC